MITSSVNCGELIPKGRSSWSYRFVITRAIRRARVSKQSSVISATTLSFADMDFTRFIQASCCTYNIKSSERSKTAYCLWVYPFGRKHCPTEVPGKQATAICLFSSAAFSASCSDESLRRRGTTQLRARVQARGARFPRACADRFEVIASAAAEGGTRRTCLLKPLEEASWHGLATHPGEVRQQPARARVDWHRLRDMPCVERCGPCHLSGAPREKNGAGGGILRYLEEASTSRQIGICNIRLPF